ncbi:MAG: MFS transporter [Ferrovibrio sp.]|uniref:MFS transporter n=1 Tax=Ferrovibrio sp. TaxID=1917215 RepID=UPI002602BCDA|nr:MFS transporter [Ferrovibrio sp.]MCW0232166.1 MFS transporter [Ferrovibrio sp.]
MQISKQHRLAVILALGTAQTLGWGSTYYLPAILAGPMAAEFGVSTSWIYGAFSVAMLLTAFIGPGVGHRIDRFGGRNILTLSSLIFAAGLALLGAAQHLAVFVAAWLLIGFGMAIGLYEAAFATLTAIYGKESRSAITGITLLAGFASTVCWPISALVDAEWGWRATCYIWAGAHLLIGLPLNRLMIPRELGAHITAPEKADGSGEIAIFTRPMLLLAFAFAVTWITSTAMAAHLPRILEAAGASKTAAIAAAALVGPAQVAARVLEHTVLRRFHPLLSARIASITHPIGVGLLLIFGAPAAYLFTLLHGAGNGVMTIAKGTLPLVIFGPVGYGRRQGWLAAPARFGQAGAPFVFALLLEWYGQHVLLFTAGLCTAGLIAMLLLRTAEPEAAGARI